MSRTNDFRIRKMSPGDINFAIRMAADEGWNPGVHDAHCFYSADPDGFFFSELDGEPIGCISAVAYDNFYGFIGLYVVRPDYRGKGYGLRLWTAAMEYLGDRNIGLDGVIAQQDNYKRSGFRLAYRNIRYEGIGKGTLSRDIVCLDEVPFDRVAAYDAGIFSVPRPDFLRLWIDQPDGAAFGYMVNGILKGYGVIRACGVGFKIGPLFADDHIIAGHLYNALAGTVPGKPVFIDVPEMNTAAMAIAKRHGMTPVFETARMYTKEPDMTQLHRVFGVTSFELG